MKRVLCDLLNQSIDRFPDKEAIIHGDSTVTYRLLSTWSASIAAYLNENGLTKGDRVAVLVQNTAEYVAIYYGVLAAGGVVVALNTATRSRDLLNWVCHSEASWLFAESVHIELAQLLKKIPKNIHVVIIGDNSTAVDRSASVSLSAILAEKMGGLEQLVAIKDDDLATIIYTSGTTGHPKGVMLSHGNLYNNTRSILKYLPLQHTDKVMNVLPFYYSYGNSVLHTHLAAGASLVLENSMMYPHRVMQQIIEHKVTVLPGVPSTFTLLQNRIKLEEYDLSSLRFITQAGGPMHPTSIEQFRKLIPNAEFFVMYGQTEASARLSYVPPNKLKSKMGSVGVPIPNVMLEIRDENGNQVPAGVTGEIWATGDNIMQGYWKDAELTAKVLVDGWLNTGDLAFQDEEGYFYLVGRSSDMIKSGAHRISPNDIEEVLLELEGVEEAVATGINDQLLGQVIKAFVVLNPVSKLDKRAVLAHCRQNLASYKIPKQVEFVDEIPKTSSGKISRYMLKEQMSEQ